MSEQAKTLLALKVITGTVTAHEQWEHFLPGKKPKRDYPGEDRQEYWDGVNESVKNAACEYVADKLEFACRVKCHG